MQHTLALAVAYTIGPIGAVNHVDSTVDCNGKFDFLDEVK